MSNNYYHTGDRIVDFSKTDEVTDAYNNGYLLTRLSKGEMIQTRSLRIDLAKFELNSENRRILRKNEELECQVKALPLVDYNWKIHALGKDFYTKKFGDGTMSAMKIKEMFNDMERSNMNNVFIYDGVGYALSYINEELVHYAYPFYDLSIPKERNIGMAMMLKAIHWSKEHDKRYIYLGSVTSKEALYKLQFEGLEWWDYDNQNWNDDIAELKHIINSVD